MSLQKSVKPLILAASIASIICAVPDAARSQAGGGALLEEIVVTATRREQNLQEIPISVFALNNEDLELRGVDRIENLDIYAPNVSVMGGSSALGETSASIIIRGLPGVATYVDGIWQNSEDGILAMNVVEVDRIEVLRGPQGTLFGKNTMGGAVQYVSSLPADEFGARIKLSTGSYDRRDVTAAVDLPVTDAFRMKITGAQLVREGFLQSLSIDRKFGDINDTVARADLVWEPNDTFSMRFIADYTNVDRNGSARVQNLLTTELNSECCGPWPRPRSFDQLAGFEFNNLTHTAGWPGGEVGEWETKSNYETQGFVLDANRYTLDMNWNIGDNMTFRSLTGHRTLYRKTYTDFDAAEITLIERDFRARNEVVTQEFQLLGGNDRVSWVGGLFYWEEDSLGRTFTYWWQEFKDDPTLEPEIRATAAAQGVAGLPPFFGHSDGFGGGEQEGQAVFGEVDFSLTDQLNLVVGVRYNDETNVSYDFVGTDVQIPARPDTDPAGCFWCRMQTNAAEADFDSTTAKFAVQYQFRDNIMGYVNYSEGFGAGGINTIDIPQITAVIPFSPEEIENFEIGLRSDLLDGRLRFNATVFSSTWDGIQVSETLPDPTCQGEPVCPNLPNLYTTNAGGAEAEGIEVELNYLVGDNVRIDFNMGLLDTAYTSVGESVGETISIGDTFQQAPDVTYSIGLQHDADLSNGGRFVSRIDYGFVDKYVRVRERIRQTFQESYGVVNLRFSYEPPQSNWRLSLFGSNLTDERYLTSGFQSTGTGQDLATVNRPREVGATLQLFFD